MNGRRTQPRCRRLVLRRSVTLATALVAGLTVGASLPPIYAQSRTAFRFIKNIQWVGSTDQLLAVSLDSDVYAVTQDTLADVRVLDEQGREVPFLLRRAVGQRRRSERRTVPSHVVSLTEQPDNRLEIVLQLKQDGPVNGLTVYTPLKNFQRRVQVFGSTDGRQWQPLVSDAVIYDYSRYMDVRHTDVRLPSKQVRWLKILVNRATDEEETLQRKLTERRSATKQETQTTRWLNTRPFRIDQIRLWREEQVVVENKPVETTYSAAAFRAFLDERNNTVLEVQTRREPLVGLTLKTPERNFSRRVLLQKKESHGLRSSWSSLARAAVWQIDVSNVRRAKLRVSFPEQRAEWYRVVIQNGNSRPLHVTGVTLHGHVFQVIFLARQGCSYRLAYGAEEVQPPQYDLTALQLLLKQTSPARATLATQPTEQTTSAPVFRFSRLKRWLNDSRVLVGAALLVAVVLGWLLYRAVDRFSETQPEQADGQVSDAPRSHVEEQQETAERSAENVQDERPHSPE